MLGILLLFTSLFSTSSIEWALKDVGEGNCAVCTQLSPGGEVEVVLIVDAGSSEAKPHSSVFLSNLFTKLPKGCKVVFCTTHADEDHLNFFTLLIEQYKNKLLKCSVSIYLGGLLDDYFDKRPARNFIEALSRVKEG